MKTHELFEVKEGLKEIVQKAIEQAVDHPDVINWDRLYDPYDSYEQALRQTTTDILDVDFIFAPFIGPGEYSKVLELVHKLARRKAVGQKRRSAQFEQEDITAKLNRLLKPSLAAAYVQGLTVYVELSGIKRKEAKLVLFQLGADVREIIQHPDHITAFLQFDTESEVRQGMKKLRRLSRGKPKFKIEYYEA